MTDDHDLLARFASLRRRIEERAPSFDAMLARAAVSRGRFGARATAAGAAAAIIAVALLLWLSHTSNPPTEVPESSMLGWKSPTDFLLDTPERALLRTVPRLGEFPQPITLQPSSLPEIAS
jgi:hypothetical protein